MSHSSLRLLVTGANGFIGKNLLVHLSEMPNIEVLTFVRGDDVVLLPALVAQADAVIHLAGENRPADESAFEQVNTGLTQLLCNALRHEALTTGRTLPLVFTSSTQATQDNAYGRSKLVAEQVIQSLAADLGNPVLVFRLPGVFGKWCKPHYNSVVATFCHNLARGLPIQVNDPLANLKLVYVDDVVKALINAVQASLVQSTGVKSPNSVVAVGDVHPEYAVSLGALAEQIEAFDACRSSLLTEPVGTGFTRALYATYVSYLPKERFVYALPAHGDSRGVFVEMLKTPDAGQFSFFTAHPGVTRGGHYHHSKTEKFLVIKGQALFRFRHLLTNELVEISTLGDIPQVVDTIPGWFHDITNTGDTEMIVMLWANEIFDHARPDTFASKV
jgi:UDP-2-acetamido-2,6-beta-L-arabino-hexul-4-ose reductase